MFEANAVALNTLMRNPAGKIGRAVAKMRNPMDIIHTNLSKRKF